MIQTETHRCESCKGSGKLLSRGTRVVRGVVRTYDFLVDCPGKLSERILPELRSGSAEIGGKP